jgi:hypothetical protein
MELTPKESEICRISGYDVSIGKFLKSATGNPVEQLHRPHPDTGDVVPINAILSRTTEENVATVLESIRAELPVEYLVFWSSSDDREDKEIIVLHIVDRFDCLRVMATNGVNYDLSTDDIVARLEDWAKRCDFEVDGAAPDWVALRFMTLPDDIDGFVSEIYDFCPDTIDQHFGCFEEMADAFEEMGEEMPPDLQELMEGVDLTDSETAGLQILKRFLRRDKSLFLWWD